MTHKNPTHTCHHLHLDDIHNHKHLDHNLLIHLHEHDGAIIASWEGAISMDYQIAVKKTKTMLEDIARWVEERGGFIGHIKSVAKRLEEGTLLSITDAGSGVNVKRGQQAQVEIKMTVIVYSINPEELQTRLSDLMIGLMTGYSKQSWILNERGK